MNNELTFDFQDGNGPVPAHRHVNPDGSEGGWVAETAWVYGDARVFGDAWVFCTARVYGTARVFGNAWVSGDAWVYGTARVYGDAWVSGDARVSGTAWVSGDVRLTKGYAFATKYNDWQVTEIDNGDGTTTLYANAEFEAVENG